MIDPDIVHAAFDVQLKAARCLGIMMPVLYAALMFLKRGLSARAEGVYNRITAQFQPIMMC